MRKELLSLAPIIGLGIIASGAFTRDKAQAIKERDRWKCTVCGATDCLDASHIDHNKKHDHYNEEKNGVTLCVEDHLKDHILRHGSNGLTKRQNEWAIERLKERLPPPCPEDPPED